MVPDEPTLEAAAGRYRACLPPGALEEIRLDGYDRVGVPTVSAVWEPADGGAAEHGVGYGSSPAAAATGALGELTEELLLGTALRGLVPQEASYAELVRQRGSDRVVDPVTLVVPAGADVDPDRPLLWVAAMRWRTGEEVLVPAEFVGHTPQSLPWPAPDGGWLTTPVTNGLGAGDTLVRAVSHGLFELVQRDGNTVSHRALDTGVVVDDSGLRDPTTRDLLARMRGAGLDVMVKLASTELAVVVHAVAGDADPLAPPMAVTAMGEAAHLDTETAVRKAVLELAASRARRAFSFGSLEQVRARHPDYLERELRRPLPAQEERALTAMTAWTRLDAAGLSALLAPTVLSRRSTVVVSDLPSLARAVLGDPAALLAHVLQRLAGFDVLVVAASATGPGGEEVHVAKVLAPGLEVETLSYLRIGERVLQRLLARDSPLVGLGRPDRPDKLPVRLSAEAAERVGGPAWLDRSEVERVLGPLYPLYREPTRHAPQRVAAGL